jgi:anhydro-N-acetylmuramic acid kinase
MLYRAIGLMSGSSLDGLDICFAEFQEQAGKWTYEIKAAACYSYEEEWKERLAGATALTLLDYQLLHTDYGHYTGRQVNQFIEDNQLQYQVALIASHGHTTFHIPAKRMTAQLGDGAAIAAATQLPVVTDLRAMDIAFGGQGAPIVPIGEKLLFSGFDYFLNIGGIANISINRDPYTAYDICAANRVLNMLANELGKEFDESGSIAATGSLDTELFEALNQLEYYAAPAPKSLSNDFGTHTVYSLIKKAECNTPDALRTYTEHIALQVCNALRNVSSGRDTKLMVTGGGAFNDFLIKRISEGIADQRIELVVPEVNLVNYKEALIMAFIGVLRWRQENNVLSSVTGATRDSIGGALWTGQEA